MHAERPEFLSGPGTQPGAAQLTALERRLLDEYQQGFPLVPHPYAEVARHLGTSEEEVIATLGSLRERGMLSRVGAVFRPNRAGASTLAALRVPPGRLAEVARTVSAYSEVNHNYQREHAYNLWFVVLMTFLFWQGFRKTDTVLRQRYLVAYLMTWGVGTCVLGTVLSSAEIDCP